MEYSNIELKLACKIRDVKKEDLEALHWFGRFYDHANIIKEAYLNHLEGRLIFLVAEVNKFPAAQLWVDFEKNEDPETTTFWAFRTFDPFRSIGIGSKLMRTAEKILTMKNIRFAEIGVEKFNKSALELYERLGFKEYRREKEVSSYITPWGEKRTDRLDLIMLRKEITAH